MAFRLWNALPPETSPARSAGFLFDGDEEPANVCFGVHCGLQSDIAPCPKSAQQQSFVRSSRLRGTPLAAIADPKALAAVTSTFRTRDSVLSQHFVGSWSDRRG
jgi:hypothetical protein